MAENGETRDTTGKDLGAVSESTATAKNAVLLNVVPQHGATIAACLARSRRETPSQKRLLNRASLPPTGWPAAMELPATAHDALTAGRKWEHGASFLPTGYKHRSCPQAISTVVMPGEPWDGQHHEQGGVQWAGSSHGSCPRITLTLSSNRMSEMENSSFAGFISSTDSHGSRRSCCYPGYVVA